MFTGIIEEIGTVHKIKKGQLSVVLEVCAKTVLEDMKIGDSIAVNGVCLTVTALYSGSFVADVMHETLKRSALAALIPGGHVNLERAMSASGRFGGHIVSGHIDGTGKIVYIQKDDNAVWFTIHTNPEIMRYVVEKGSVAIDGISLTIAKADRDRFSISAIPHTVRQTVLNERKEGDSVNLEADIVGKYVGKFLSFKQNTDSHITKEFLEKYGY